jgi:putative colanic acid biosynthesis glycosyltransferase
MSRNIKILQINSVNFGSTGSIIRNISKAAEEHEYISYFAYADSRSNKNININNNILIGNIFERNLHIQLSYYTGYNGCFSYSGTKRFLREIDMLKPDVIHLHNLHNCYINLKMLFDYIKQKEIPVVWTLHDCWSFTGQCPHFSMVKCNRWKTGCFDCPQYKEYPSSKVDRTKKMYELKKKWFRSVKNMTIVTPSQWLADLVGESFLKVYPVKVINNGVDLNIFKPKLSNFRNKFKLQDKFIILGVASPWSIKKGLNEFLNLSECLDTNYRIVLVGLNEEQMKMLPENIIGINKTENAEELAEIYSAADVFINPTLEDNFPTTNIEALACGTPVITYNTGGSPEAIGENCGTIIESGNVGQLMDAIVQIKKNGKDYYIDSCRKRTESHYNHRDRYEDYLKLYDYISN